MYKNLLIQAGLNENEAIIYEYMINNGESAAFDILKKTPLKKGVLYLALNALIEKGVIRQKMLKSKNPNVRNVKKIAYFSPEHPEKLKEFLKSEENKIKLAEKNLLANLHDLIASFNLASNKPGVQYFEGEEGVRKVLWDSLKKKTLVYTYANMDTVNEYIPKLNKEYAKERDRLKVKKKAILIIKNPETAKKMVDYHTKTTETRFINQKLYQFKALMEVYDNKISYITLSKKGKMGVIIEDKDIFEMHKQLFELLWANLKN